MTYNLTYHQKGVVTWLVHQIRAGDLPEEFTIAWLTTTYAMPDYTGDTTTAPDITKGALDALVANGLLLCTSNYRMTRGTSRQYESSRQCTITGAAYEAVDQQFHAPDTSFMRHLTPLANPHILDDAITRRCLPILGAGSSDPALWDSAVRTAGVILEERLRDVGGITDPNRIGQNLVNDVFGQRGSLAAKFTVESERMGYRDMFAGIVGAFRNPAAHRLVDPEPEEGGVFIMFVNLLLTKLEELR